MTQISAPGTVPLLSFRRIDRPFDPPDGLASVREESPLSRMTYPDGHLGWLATGHAEVRAILADRRFSSRYELMHDPFGPDTYEPMPTPVGDLTGTDPPEHTRYRRLLAGRFTGRRIGLLTDRIEQIAAGLLDRMSLQGTSADLVEAYARPISALTICELLGAPYSDQEYFQELTATMAGLNIELADRMAAFTAMQEFIQRLVTSKRDNPTDDVLSELAKSDLTDEELAGVGAYLLGAGMDASAQMLAMGVFALLCHPEQLLILRLNPETADAAVEELLRYLSITHTSARAALEDVELAGQVIRQGETVTVAIHAANRDPARFPHPDALDLGRRTSEHVAFGHGIHQCLAQHLARIQMRVGYVGLFERFPTLRLAVAPTQVRMYSDMNMNGVHELPVAWDPS